LAGADGAWAGREALEEKLGLKVIDLGLGFSVQGYKV